jgi:autotransporter adhesin
LKTVTDPTTGAINLQMADAPVFTSVTTGNSLLDTNGLTIAGGPSVTTAGINAANMVITNVAPGAINATSTDAVNGSQLHGVSQSIANTLGGGSVINPDGTVTGPTYAIQGGNYSTVYDAFTAVDGNLTTLNNAISGGGGIKYFHANSTLADSLAVGVNSVAVGPVATAAADDSVAIGNGATASNVGDVALGSGSTTSTAVATQSIIIAGNTYSFAGTAPTSTVSVGSLGAERTITNVAAGQITATSTDAVNGSQLYATNQALGAVAAQSGNTGQIAVKYDWNDANGNNVVDAGEVDYNKVTLAGNGGTTLTNVAAGAVNSTSSDAVNGSQLYAVGTSTANALGGTSSFDPATGTVTAGLTVGGNSYSSVQDAITAVNTTAGAGWNVTTKATGSGTVTNSSVTKVAPGSTATFTAGNNIAITQNGAEVQVALQQDITVNSIKTNSVSVTNGPTINSGGITLASGDTFDAGGNAITNVGTGVNATDAVNVGQFSAGLSNVLNQANSYTDQRINALSFDLSKIKRDQSAGTASAMAMSQVPQAFEPGMGIVGIGVSTWGGEQALAMGFSKASDNGRIVVKATGTYNSRGVGGAAAGVGFQF